jgi:hypothetical protein
MTKSIAIKCKAAGLVPVDDLEIVQGRLKYLSEARKKALKKRILSRGFMDPLGVWESPNGRFVLSGTHRLLVIRELIAEGYKCPELPCNFVHADNLAQAKEDILAMSSSYAVVQEDALDAFLNGTKITNEDLLSDFAISDFSMRDFLDKYRVDLTTPISPAEQKYDTAKQMLSTQAGGPVPDRSALDNVSNTQKYKNEAQSLENFLASETRRITIYANPTDYDTIVNKFNALATEHGLTDFKDVVMHLLDQYENT